MDNELEINKFPSVGEVETAESPSIKDVLAPEKEDLTIVEPIMTLESVLDWADRVRNYT